MAIERLGIPDSVIGTIESAPTLEYAMLAWRGFHNEFRFLYVTKTDDFIRECACQRCTEGLRFLKGSYETAMSPSFAFDLWTKAEKQRLTQTFADRSGRGILSTKMDATSVII